MSDDAASGAVVVSCGPVVHLHSCLGGLEVGLYARTTDERWLGTWVNRARAWLDWWPHLLGRPWWGVAVCVCVGVRTGWFHLTGAGLLLLPTPPPLRLLLSMVAAGRMW